MAVGGRRGEAKAEIEIARVQGGPEGARQELYRPAVRVDGEAVREDDAEAKKAAGWGWRRQIESPKRAPKESAQSRSAVNSEIPDF
jgi:hypothetical protein